MVPVKKMRNEKVGQGFSRVLHVVGFFRVLQVVERVEGREAVGPEENDLDGWICGVRRQFWASGPQLLAMDSIGLGLFSLSQGRLVIYY